jgi:hypothetical protein
MGAACLWIIACACEQTARVVVGAGDDESVLHEMHKARLRGGLQPRALAPVWEMIQVAISLTEDT